MATNFISESGIFQFMYKCYQKCKLYRKSPTRSRAAYIWARLVEWVHKPWLLFENCFPNERLGWLVYEIQHLPIYIHLQAMACKQGWLQYERGLSNEFFFQTNITRVASGWGLTVQWYKHHTLCDFLKYQVTSLISLKFQYPLPTNIYVIQLPMGTLHEQ